MGFNTKEDITTWTINQTSKYGIRHPDTHSATEIVYACPEIPMYVMANNVRDEMEMEMDDGA